MMEVNGEFRSLINQYHNYGSTPVLLPTTINDDQSEMSVN